MRIVSPDSTCTSGSTRTLRQDPFSRHLANWTRTVPLRCVRSCAIISHRIEVRYRQPLNWIFHFRFELVSIQHQILAWSLIEPPEQVNRVEGSNETKSGDCSLNRCTEINRVL